MKGIAMPLLRTTIIAAMVWAILSAAACGREDVTVQEEAVEAQTPFDQEEMARQEALSRPPAPIKVIMPEVNPRRGRILFITKGCVICHQINEVGGTAAPPIDYSTSQASVDPLEFSARIWRGAIAMTALQSIELGYVIDLDGQDIADLAAFAVSGEERALLTIDSVPAAMRDWFLNTPYWRTEEWSEYLRRGERIPLDDMPD
jgi:hypothetical protein